MNTQATASFQNPQVVNTVLSGFLDSFMRLIAKPEPASTYSTGDTFAAPIGDGEYAVLLLGIEQCADLIPRMENVVSRMASGRFRADGESLKCTVGVARCPLDAEDLVNLIRMASTAASELGGGGPQYQFISRRHRQN